MKACVFTYSYATQKIAPEERERETDEFGPEHGTTVRSEKTVSMMREEQVVSVIRLLLW
jgi:hypothetical protein